MIATFNTFIHPLAESYVKDVLTSTFISEGKLVKKFEQKLENELGLKNAAAVNSGTTALHLALVLAGIGEGDEVIIPAQTFVATGLVVLQQNAIPVFADIDYATGNISVESLESKITAKTKAVIPVHWGGYPCKMHEINAVAAKHGLVVIEDAAHALGAMYKGKPIGSLSHFTCFSFQAIKHLTTGDGGALCCKSEKDFNQAIIRRWFGIDRAATEVSLLGERQYSIKDLGFKYHLNDYAAALGLANMEGYAERLARRRKMAAAYVKGLSDVPGIQLFEYEAGIESAYWLFGFHVEKRENFIKSLREKGIVASVVHQRIDRNEVFGGLRDDLENQQRFDESQVHIPLHDALNNDDVEYIVETIRQGW